MKTLPQDFKGFGKYSIKSKNPYFISQRWNKVYLMFFYGEENIRVCEGNLINFGRKEEELEFNSLTELKDFIINNKPLFHFNQQEDILKEIEELK